MIEKKHFHRNSLRMVPDNFSDFTIIIHFEQFQFQGSIGNISETGTLALFPPQITHRELLLPFTKINGSIESAKYQIFFPFDGSITWAALQEHRKKQYFSIGIHFETGYILPDTLYALSVAQD